MRLIKLGIVIFSMFLLCGCPDELPMDDAFIKIVNNSGDNIVWSYLSNTTAIDTSILSESLPWRNLNDYIIYAGETYIQAFNKEGFISILENGWYQYYLFSYDSLITIPWERIRDENIILKKVYFETWEEMEACNFTITYP
ncbi:MAG: hypothetical protein GQ564_18220 [Bacteroidales bacterium]|nr:hypothetical protein [Bacteroidales bacterium]